MATDPTFVQRLNTPGGGAAIGAVGNAINAIMDGRAARDMYANQTQQIREQVAFDRKVMEEQAALRAQEVQRQQLFARAAGDAFMRSLGGYKDAEAGIGRAGNSIADTFRSVLTRPAPASSAPAAIGPTADRIASATEKAGGDVMGEAGKLAAVQGLAKAFSENDMAVGRERQLASLLNNFAGGSAGAAQSEIDSRAGRFFKQKMVKPAPSMLGDFFVGLSNLGVKYANQPSAAANPYALSLPPAEPTGLRVGSGEGLSPARPSGVGIRVGNRIIGG